MAVNLRGGNTELFEQKTFIFINQMNRRKEGNVLFNDALNTFYLRSYGVRYMVKDHSDSENGNPLSIHRQMNRKLNEYFDVRWR